MVPTAKEQLIENWGVYRRTVAYTKKRFKKNNLIDLDDIITEMKLCAKLHCAEQERVIREKVRLLKQSDWGTYENIDPSSKPNLDLVDIVNINKYGHGDCTYYIITVSKDSILNAYPLDNIK